MDSQPHPDQMLHAFLQDLILVGDGFNAVLTLTNGPTNTLTNVTVTLRFYNSTGADITSSSTL